MTGLQEGSEKRGEFGSPTRMFVVRRDNAYDLVDELTSNDGFWAGGVGLLWRIADEVAALRCAEKYDVLGMHSTLQILMTSGLEFKFCFNGSLLRGKRENW